ncbi:MAG: hypothetical protein CMK36_08365 [Porticoccaceae bacterium]|nr:hypothetical protein [Porticoccaceae bacterium]
MCTPRFYFLSSELTTDSLGSACSGRWTKIFSDEAIENVEGKKNYLRARSAFRLSLKNDSTSLLPENGEYSRISLASCKSRVD